MKSIKLYNFPIKIAINTTRYIQANTHTHLEVHNEIDIILSVSCIHKAIMELLNRR